MDMETWNARLSIVNEWLENSPDESDDFEDAKDIITMMCRRADKRGNGNPDLLKKMWNIVRQELKQFDDAPITRRSVLPLHVQQSLGIILNEVYAGHYAFFESGASISLVHFRRSRGVVSTYTTADDYAEHKTKTLKNQLLRLWKNNQWDGTQAGLENIDHNNHE